MNRKRGEGGWEETLKLASEMVELEKILFILYVHARV